MFQRMMCLAIGYVFGLIQWGFIIGRIHGVDIRQHGSGNSGATNTLRVLGTGAGISVLFLDAFKCIAAIILTYFLFAKGSPELKVLLRYYTAFGVILGHNYPVWLKFKGGKGISATAGLICSMGPLWIIGNLSLFIITFVSTHFVSLGSLVIYGAFFIETIICGQCGVFDCAGTAVPQAVLCELYVVTFLMTAMAYWRHRKNIIRLIHHEESKVYLSKKNREKHEEIIKDQKPII